MKWYSENNVREFLAGRMVADDLLAVGCDVLTAIVWDNPEKAARALADELFAVPLSHPHKTDFVLLCTQNKDLVLWALRNVRNP